MPSLVRPVVAPGRVGSIPQPVLRSDDLVLRPWSRSDTPRLVEAFDDPAIQEWHLQRLDSDDEAAQWVARWQHRWRTEQGASWAITNDADVVLGQVGFRALHLADGLAECSCWTLAVVRGNGVATHALRALTDWALDHLRLHRIEIMHSIRNGASCRMASKAGYRPEGTLRSHQLHRDGWHDMHLHARIHSEP